MEGNNASKSKVDGYGFERPEDFDYVSYNEFMSTYLTVLTRRAQRWQDKVSKKEDIDKSGQVKRFCRKGIPNELRPRVWMAMSGAEQRMKDNPGLYHRLLSGEMDPKLVDTVTMDIHRTFPENIYFTLTEDPSGLRGPLYNVLISFAHHNLRVGYCQGMNFITGLLLLMLKDEEKVFWLCDTLFTQILPDYYAPDMNALKAEQELLGEIVRWKLPSISKHMEALGVPWGLIGMKWFICLYADVLPTETVYRIWDCLFYEGSKILLRVALTMIDINKEKILACKNFTHVVELFKSVPIQPEILFCHSFMKQIFKRPGSFPRTRITRLRADSVQKVTS